jgi:uncharacterized protein (TIGR02452 family)
MESLINNRDVNSKEYLEDMAMDTLKLVSREYYTYEKDNHEVECCLTPFNDKARQQTVTYDKAPILQEPNMFPNTKYEVVNETTIGSVLARREELKDRNVGILNFGSATKPCGGWLNGKAAQEEDIARKTNLYVSLKYQDAFYNSHDEANPLYSNRCIYSPSIAIIKDDGFNTVEPFLVNVLTSAAINIPALERYPAFLRILKTFQCKSEFSTYINQTNFLINEVMVKRIENILSVAAFNKVDALVLGAYGCGVFGHDAKMVAKYFKYLLVEKGYEKYFKHIIFAVYDKSFDQYNFNAFKHEFK